MSDSGEDPREDQVALLPRLPHQGGAIGRFHYHRKRNRHPSRWRNEQQPTTTQKICSDLCARATRERRYTASNCQLRHLFIKYRRSDNCRALLRLYKIFGQNGLKIRAIGVAHKNLHPQLIIANYSLFLNAKK